MLNKLPIEKIVLGTAQFGRDYGISNIHGNPSRREILQILTTAWEKGVRRFDTAPGYNSEKILGKFIAANGLQDEAIVLTKIPSLEGISDYREHIRSNLDSSLKHLGCHVNVLFFHNSADSVLALEDPGFFVNLLSDYPVSNIGISVYEPQEVENLSDCQFELAYQFPLNILDRRFENVDMTKGKRYARSLFLQGLLASKNKLRRNAAEELSLIQHNYHKKLAENRLDPIRYVVSFAHHSNYLDYSLFGVDTVDQLLNILNINCYDAQKLNTIDFSNMYVDEHWLDPRTWN